MDHSVANEALKFVPEIAPLLLPIDLGYISGCGNYRQDPQGRADRERLHGGRHFQVTHQGSPGVQTEKPVLVVIQVLPRDVGQVSGQPQADPQTGILAFRRDTAAPQALTNRTGEHSMEQLTAKVLDQSALLRLDPPHLSAYPADRPHDLKDEIFQAFVTKGKGKVRLRFPRRRSNYACAIAVSVRFNNDVEV